MTDWPTITYGKGWWDDLLIVNPLYTWVLQGTGGGDTGTMTFIYGDYMDLDLTAVGGDASIHAEYPDSGGANNIAIGSTTYTYCFYRFKCSNANVKAKITEVWSDDAEKTILAETNSETWTYGATTVTGGAGKNVDHVRLYATTAVGHVYYDFLCIAQGVFEFPGANLIDFYGPPCRSVDTGIPGKDGVDHQNLGSEPAEVHILADMDTTTDWNLGKVFDQIAHDQSNDLWQWLTLPAHDRQFKAYMPRYNLPFQNGILGLNLFLKEYKRADARALENYAERFGH